MRYPKFAHTAIITGATGCGKTKYIMKLLTNEYENYFDNVVVMCPTFDINSTYQEYIHLFNRPKHVENTTNFYYDLVETALCDRIKMHKTNLNGSTLFVVDDLASDSITSRKNTELSKLAVRGRHEKHSLWVLTQKYNMIDKDIRAQTMFVTAFYTKDKKSFNDMLMENYTGEVNQREIFNKLMSNRYAYVFIKTFFKAMTMVIIPDENN